jgi:hypothetical protein
VLVVLVVEVLVVVVVVQGHWEQPWQNQFAQAFCQPPRIEAHTEPKQFGTVVTVVVVVVVLVVVLVVDVVVVVAH